MVLLEKASKDKDFKMTASLTKNLKKLRKMFELPDTVLALSFYLPDLFMRLQLPTQPTPLAAGAKLEDVLHCVVCMVTPRSVVLQLCNHYVCCLTCAAAQDKCPATGCNTNITNRVNNVCSAPHLQAFEVS